MALDAYKKNLDIPANPAMMNNTLLGRQRNVAFLCPNSGRRKREVLFSKEWAKDMAKKKKNPVEVYQMICGSCQSRNYVMSLKRENKSLEISKFCPNERKHTPHKAKKA
jgi:ribosomal protein L33